MSDEIEELNTSNASFELPTDIVEVGNAAIWSLSTCKPSFGVEQIRDDDLDTFWQSEGPQPHTISIQFAKKMTLCLLGLYLDYKADESYTPQDLVIKAGSCHADLQDLCSSHVNEPVGWVYIPLYTDEDRKKPLRAHLLQIVIVKNHQLGKDSHIRQVKVWAPRPPLVVQDDLAPFSSVEFNMYSVIR